MEKKLVFVIVFTCICIISFIWVLTSLVKENSRCLKSPLVYGANTIINSKGEIAESLCSCTIYLEGGVNEFYFDKYGLYRENPLLKEINYYPN